MCVVKKANYDSSTKEIRGKIFQIIYAGIKRKVFSISNGLSIELNEKMKGFHDKKWFQSKNNKMRTI